MRSLGSTIAMLVLATVSCARGEDDVASNGSGGSCGTQCADGGAGSAGSAVCIPGKQEACACPGGEQGAQKCRADGSGFEECACGSAGASGAGGWAGSSGAAGSSGLGGSAGNGGSGGSTGCPSGEKLCASSCVVEGPNNGCAAASCQACSAPTNGVAICTSGQCDFSCNAGFQKSGSACVPAGSGACNPLSPSSSAGGYTPCASGQTCIPSSTGATTCVASGNKGFEQPCTTHAECAPGFACAKEFIGGFHCIQYCLNAANCTGTYLCAGPFNPPLYAGTQQLSYCW